MGSKQGCDIYSARSITLPGMTPVKTSVCPDWVLSANREVSPAPVYPVTIMLLDASHPTQHWVRGAPIAVMPPLNGSEE